jgi:precorrin-2 methylase
LVVVGVGINGAPQTTLEAVECIRRADVVFYVVPDPTTAFWIRRLNPAATTLDDLYVEGKNRYQTYRDMVTRIVSAVANGRRVCAVFYGHPGVLVMASHWAIARVRRLGLDARMAPGVSSEACLFADLGINPGQHGVQSYEATDFLSSRRRIDPTANLVLWQVGVLGEPSVREAMRGRPERVARLVRRLRRAYPANHKVVLYQAATFPGAAPTVKRVPLDRLPRVRIFSGATLYVPPTVQREPDGAVLRWYGEA